MIILILISLCGVYYLYDLKVFNFIHFIIASIFVIWINNYGPLVVTLWLLHAYFHSGSEKIKTHFAPIESSRPANDSIMQAGLAWKQWLNSLSAKRFYDMRIEVDVAPGPGVVSRGYPKLSNILQQSNVSISGRVVDICSGRGGWTQRCLIEPAVDMVTAITLSAVGHEPFMVRDARVQLLLTDYLSVQPIKIDTLLFDGGEAHSSPLKEADLFFRLLSGIEPWLALNPSANFVIKLLTPYDPRVRQFVKRVQEITGRGSIHRCAYSRNSSMEFYLASGPSCDVDQTITFLMEKVRIAGLHPSATISYGEAFLKAHRAWSDVDRTDMGKMPLLKGFDMSASLAEVTRDVLMPPRKCFEFFEELGYFPQVKFASGRAIINPFVDRLMKPIAGLPSGMAQWRLASTDSRETYLHVVNKLDKAPCENHGYNREMRLATEALVKYMKKKGCSLRRLTEREIANRVNRTSSMGVQENSLGFSDMGEYIDSKVWPDRVKRYMRCLRAGRPILSIFNTMGKHELKKSIAKEKKASRLVWYLPATARLAEMQIMGSFMDILHHVPGSVSGFPLYDYGELMQSRSNEGDVFVADDVASWDAKLSLGDLERECWAMMQLTDDDSLKNDIRSLYELYSHKLAIVSRPAGSHDEKVIIKTRGMRGSGEVTTYGLNTWTNVVVNMARMAVSEAPSNLALYYDELLSSMAGGGEIGMLISGDDCVVSGPLKRMSSFAKRGGQFMGEIGKPRKNLGVDEPSPIEIDMARIEFCSHTYSRVEIVGNDERSYYRWMPTRSVGEIFSKARTMKNAPIDVNVAEAWARVVAIGNLILYPHISDCRYLFSAVASACRSNLLLTGMREVGWPVKFEILDENTVLDIVNEQLFGRGTHFPQEARIRSLYQIKPPPLPQQIIIRGGAMRSSWRRALGCEIGMMRHTIVYHIRRYGDPQAMFDDIYYSSYPRLPRTIKAFQDGVGLKRETKHWQVYPYKGSFVPVLGM
jgi:hypothetical protein